jgi:hypothetical protein
MPGNSRSSINVYGLGDSHRPAVHSEAATPTLGSSQSQVLFPDSPATAMSHHGTSKSPSSSFLSSTPLLIKF